MSDVDLVVMLIEVAFELYSETCCAYFIQIAQTDTYTIRHTVRYSY